MGSIVEYSCIHIHSHNGTYVEYLDVLSLQMYYNKEDKMTGRFKCWKARVC